MRDEEKPREDLLAELESLRDENARLQDEAADRAKVQEALRLSEERFFKAFHASPDVIVITTQSDARIVEVNPAIERIFGHTREEALGRTVVDLGHWKNLPARDDMLRLLRERGEVRNFEVQFVSKGGDEGVCELSALPIELGGVPCLLSVIRDVTEQKRMEQALRAETALLEGLMESLPGIFWVTDEKRNLRRWNARLERVSGKSAAEIARMRGPDFIRPESRQVLDQARHRTLSEGEAAAEVQVIAAGGSDVPYLLSASRVELAGELFLVGVGIDITEQRQLKREVLEISSRERQRVGQDLHDGLGQQLTGIAFLARALAQKLAAKGLPEADDVHTIQQRVTTALSQTRFLAWGLLPVSFDTAGLTATLEELAANATELFGLHCTVRVGADVEVDNEEVAAHLCHVAREAVTNAARHATASEVGIGITQTAHALTLTVEDNGVGILPAGERREGLGLRIMQYRAHLIGASLTVTRATQRGTIVTCALPRAGAIP